MFKPDLALKIVDGEKTQTRRPLSDKPGSPWFKGGCRLKPGMIRAVVPGRGKPGIAHVRIEAVELTTWWLSEEDALAEGFKPGPNGSAVWYFARRIGEMYGKDFDLDQPCWKVTFKKTAHVPALVDELRAEAPDA